MIPRRRADGCRARAIALAGLLLGAACVTTYEDAPLLGTHSTDDGRVEPAPAEFLASLTIPFGDGAADPTQPVVAEFYGGVLQRMHEAAVERDPATLESLVASYTRPDLPEHMQQRVKGYGEIARGLRFREHARAHAKLVSVPVPLAAGEDPAPMEAGQPALGAPLHLELQLPAGGLPVVLGGKADAHPIVFQVSIVVEEATAEGGTGSSSYNTPVWLPEAFALQGAAVLRLPLTIDLPGGNAVKRDVTVRVDLIQGYVQHEHGLAPVPRTTIAAVALTQWPVGYGNVAKAPLAELRSALRAFEPKSFARAFLAAQATTGDDRATAIELLVEQVRFGRVDQAQVAMAALRAITDSGVAIGDRDGWLAWWQDRTGR